jgi:hypothetical protein
MVASPPLCYVPRAVPPPSPAITAPAARDGRRAVVERVLRIADELERRARAGQGGAAGRLALATEAGVVSAGTRRQLVLGRAAGCDVVLGGRHVSRRHAAVVLRPDGWWVEDLGSRNGTWCDGERILRRRVTDGAAIQLGDVTIRCRLR